MGTKDPKDCGRHISISQMMLRRRRSLGPIEREGGSSETQWGGTAVNQRLLKDGSKTFSQVSESKPEYYLFILIHENKYLIY